MTDFIARVWRGEEKLWKAFWILYVGVSLIELGIFYSLIFITDNYYLWISIDILWVILNIFICLCLWRCILNVQKRFWSYAVTGVAIVPTLFFSLYQPELLKGQSISYESAHLIQINKSPQYKEARSYCFKVLSERGKGKSFHVKEEWTDMQGAVETNMWMNGIIERFLQDLVPCVDNYIKRKTVDATQ